MKCSACGADVVENSVYCHKCGERLDLQNRAAASSGRTNGVARSEEDPSEREAPRPDVAAAQRVRDMLESARGNNDRAEDELWEGGYSGKAMMGAWMLGGLVTLGLLVLAIAVWSSPALRWIVLAVIVLLWIYLLIVLARRRLGVHYRLTSQRFFHEKGILVHTTDLIEVIDMDDITYTQTILDRLFGVGTIRIVSSDQSHPDLSIQGIAGVGSVAAMLHEARHAERVRRGLHIESI